MKDIAAITCLTFDVVGTLIDFEAGIADFMAGLGCRPHREEVLRIYAEEEEVQQRLTPEMTFTDMMVPIFDRMAPRLGLAPGQGRAMQESIARWPAFPDSVAALRRLGARYRLVAMTNADNRALGLMAKTLGQPFDDTVTCEDAGVNKPDPRVFAYCAGRQSVAGVTRAQIMHVAQSQYHDIGVAMRLGHLTCWIERRAGSDGFGATPEPDVITTPDLHFATLAELADHLGA